MRAFPRLGAVPRARAARHGAARRTGPDGDRWRGGPRVYRRCRPRGGDTLAGPIRVWGLRGFARGFSAWLATWGGLVKLARRTGNALKAKPRARREAPLACLFASSDSVFAPVLRGLRPRVWRWLSRSSGGSAAGPFEFKGRVVICLGLPVFVHLADFAWALGGCISDRNGALRSGFEEFAGDGHSASA